MRLSQIAPQRQRSSNELSRWIGLDTISWTELIATERAGEIQFRPVFWVLISILRQSLGRVRTSSVQGFQIGYLLKSLRLRTYLKRAPGPLRQTKSGS